MSQITNPIATGEVVVFKPRLYFQIVGYFITIFTALLFPLCYFGYASLSKFETDSFNGITYSTSSESASPWVVFIGAVIISLAMLGISFFAYLGSAGQRLVIGPGGMIYRSGTRGALFITWDDIEGYGSTYPGNGSKLKGFYVYEYVLEENQSGVENSLTGILVILKPFLIVGFAIFRIISGIGGANPAVGLPGNLNYRRFIPLNIFSKNWEQDEIGEIIARYCPRLFIPKSDPNEHTVIEGVIPVPNRKQPESLKPPAKIYLKGGLLIPILGSLTLVVVLIFGFSLLTLHNRDGGPFAPPHSTYYDMVATATASARASADNSQLSDLVNFANELPVAYGPNTGDLPETANNHLNTTVIPLTRFKTAVATAQITNPDFEKAGGSWYYGFTLIISPTQSYRLLIDNGEYTITVVNGTDEKALKSGKVPKMATQAGEINTIAVYETSKSFSFTVNNNLLDSVNPSDPIGNFEVELAYYPIIKDATTKIPLHYKDFTVRGVQN